MPNERVLKEKQAAVESLAKKMQDASAGVFVDYKGITVAQDTALRGKLRDNNVDYAVIKNTITSFAVEKIGFDELKGILNGTTALAVSMTDPVISAKILCEFAAEYQKKNPDKFKIKAGFVDGKVISVNEVKALAALPSKEVLVAKVLGTMMAPVSGRANVLNANIRGLAVALNAIAEKKAG